MDLHTFPERRRAALAVAAAVAVAASAVAAAIGAPPAAHAATAPQRAPLAATLPPDFPADVPVPPGTLQSSTGGGGQWSLLMLVSGSAAQAQRSTVAFYRAHGFALQADSILQKGRHRVTIVVENRDHSPNETFIAIGVQTVAPAISGRVTLHSTLTGRAGAHGTATVTITGTRVCWRFRGVRGVRPSSAAIRQGTAGQAGPVMIPLGARYRATGCATAEVGRSIAARPTGFYVAIATRTRPLGAIRGQLRR